MTWLKLGQEFVTEIANLGLSDAAFRTPVEGLAHATDRENDGIFPEREVRRFAESPDAGHATQELIDKGVWLRRSDGKLQIVHHIAEQPTAEYLHDKRQVETNRQRRFRETKALEAKGLTPEAIEAALKERGINQSATNGKTRRGKASDPSVTRDVTRDTTRDPERNGAERNGAERTRKEALEDEALSSSNSDSPSSSSPGLSPQQDQGWLNWEAAPVGDDPSKCTSSRCSGRVTEYNKSQGIHQCNDCLSRAAARQDATKPMAL